MANLYRIHSASYDGKAIPQALNNRAWDLAVIGNEAIDARSGVACAFSSSHSSTRFQMNYDVAIKQIMIDQAKAQYGAIRTKLRGITSLLIEATTLNCPEILNLLRAAKDEGVKKVSFLYLEPLEYRRTLKGLLSDHRDFNLSENCRFQSVHGFMANLYEIPQGQAVFFLGFEKSRLGQALEQEEALQQWTKHAVFGVPAFEPSWEIDSIANNVQHLASSHYQVQYAPASGVAAAYGLLNQLLHEDKTDSPIVVAPLGTKPHTIGASLFLVEHNAFDRAVLLYDHPHRRQDRSADIRRWHLYDVHVENSNL